MALGNFYLTDAGNALLARAQAGTTLTITRAQIGEGTWPDGTNYANITALVTPLKYLTIVRKAESSGQARITVQFSNSGVGRSFQWREFALWAADPDYPDDRSHDILYGTAYAGDAPVPIESGLTEFVFNVIIKTGAATSINVLVDSSLVYMTLEELDAMRGVPNGIAELGEDGKVLEEQLPEMDYDQAGSAQKVQNNLNAHTNNKNNPHGVTPDLIGAVPTTRKVNGKPLSADATLSAADVGAIPASQKGAAGGVAELDEGGHVPASQLPSYVDDVIEGYCYNGNFYSDSSHQNQISPETGKVYVDVESNITYRWSGSAYIPIGSDLALGETSSTAYRGDRGKIAYDHSQIKNSNPHGVNPDLIGAVPTTRKVNGKPLSADVTLDAEDVGARPSNWTPSAADVGALPNTGGTLNGNLTGKYITGTWLQGTEDNHMGSAATKICVQDQSGWVYHRTPAEILSDIGITYGTEDIGAGASLTTGKIYFVYE